jgi:hypothetical protein
MCVCGCVYMCTCVVVGMGAVLCVCVCVCERERERERGVVYICGCLWGCQGRNVWVRVGWLQLLALGVGVSVSGWAQKYM